MDRVDGLIKCTEPTALKCALPLPDQGINSLATKYIEPTALQSARTLLLSGDLFVNGYSVR
jgi:hypothetical protein